MTIARWKVRHLISAAGHKTLIADSDLKRAKETYLQQLQELHRTKPKEKADEGLLEQLARLDAEYTIAKDDLVRIPGNQSAGR